MSTPLEDMMAAIATLNTSTLSLTSGFPEGVDSDKSNESQIVITPYDGNALGDFPAEVMFVQVSVYHANYNQGNTVCYNLYKKFKQTKRLTQGDHILHAMNPRQPPYFLRITDSGMHHWLFNAIITIAEK
jgi:hypothetical protein